MLNSMNDSIIIQSEVWFLPADIVMIISTFLSIVLGLIFLFAAITHRTCWSVQILLICHSCFAEVILSLNLLNMAIFTFEHDFKQNTGNISFCITLAFLVYTTDCLQNYSYLLTAIYRYISVVYPTKILWQSTKVQVVLIIALWIFCIIFALPLLLFQQIYYNIDNQICQVPFRLSIPIIYISVILYMIPNISILSIYIKLTRYVHAMSVRTTATQTLFHGQRELRLVHRTFILANTLIILGMPFAIFVLMSFFTIPPKYHFRIAFIFADISVLSILIITYYFTPQIRTIIRKKFIRSTAIVPIRFTART